MPLSWVKVFCPMTALFGASGMPVLWLTVVASS
jgi:hypothetical protein